MTISVIIPTYNRRNVVPQAIDSVLHQSVPVAEIIVVDDGSSDGTVEAIQARYGSRVTPFRQENSGASAARNRGLREAHGEWIAFLDSDDLWFPAKIERQLEALSAFAGHAHVCFTDNSFGANPVMTQTVFEAAGFAPGARIGILQEPASCILGGLEPFYTSSFLIRRSLLSESGGFDEALVVREDTDLFFRLSFRSKFCFVAEPLVQIDRTPFREIGLCNLYATRDDRKHDTFKRLYTKWLAMPEVAGTRYEPIIRELERSAYYNSAEARLHDFRIGPALHDISRLREMGAGYGSILRTFASRKIRKLLKRSLRAQQQSPTPRDGQP